MKQKNLKTKIDKVKLWVTIRMLSKKAIKEALKRVVKSSISGFQDLLISRLIKNNPNISEQTLNEVRQAFNDVEIEAIKDIKRMKSKAIIIELVKFLKK